MRYETADDVLEMVKDIVEKLDMDYIDAKRIRCVRSYGSKSRAVARIWPMPKIWQISIGIKPSYVIEVISERFDSMDEEEKKKTIIHELLHIPKNFSGALLSHKAVHFNGSGGHSVRRINRKVVEALYKRLKSSRKTKG